MLTSRHARRKHYVADLLTGIWLVCCVFVFCLFVCFCCWLVRCGSCNVVVGSMLLLFLFYFYFLIFWRGCFFAGGGGVLLLFSGCVWGGGFAD